MPSEKRKANEEENGSTPKKELKTSPVRQRANSHQEPNSNGSVKAIKRPRVRQTKKNPTDPNNQNDANLHAEDETETVQPPKIEKLIQGMWKTLIFIFILGDKFSDPNSHRLNGCHET